MFTIVLKHIGGERKVVPVEFISPGLTYLSIRWGQSGIYDLNLGKNVLTARSQKAQRKGKAYWAAEDINAVRKMARDYLDEKRGNPKEEAKEAYKKHVESMPKAKPWCDSIEPYPSYKGDPEV